MTLTGSAVHYRDAFADFYARYYTRWIKEFSPGLLAHFGAVGDGRQLLDLCCGSGETTAVFAEAGWQVTGVDLSGGMLDQARQRLAGPISAGRVRLVQADATAFELPEPAEVCVCLDGALNHLLSESDLRAAFDRVAAALSPSGRFLFDLYEPAHFQRWHNLSVLDEPDAIIVKRGIWDADRGYGMLRVSGAFGEAESCRRVDQNLRSQTYSRADVEQWLKEAGFRPYATSASAPPCPCGHLRPDECHTVYEAEKL